MKRSLQRVGLVVVVAALSGQCSAQTASRPSAEKPSAAPAPGTRAPLSVAVLDFAASTPAEPDLGKQIGESLMIMLSGEPGLRMVDRATLARTLQELELNLSGVVETNQAVKVGKVVGARLLVTGKAFTMGKEVFLTAKLIGTETSLVDGVMVKGPADADLAALVMELCEKLSARLRQVGPKLVAPDEADAGPLPALKSRLANRTKPVVAVVVLERHMTSRPALPPDPAVETEIKLLLRECGFTVKDVNQHELADFVRAAAGAKGTTWPQGLEGVDIVIVGEAFSELGARIGNLVSCLARAEINVIRRKDGQIALADRATERAIDLAENTAGKKALEKSGRVLGLRVLEYLASLPAD